MTISYFINVLKKFNPSYIKKEKERRKKSMRETYYDIFDMRIDEIKEYLDDNSYLEAFEELESTKRYISLVKSCNGKEVIHPDIEEKISNLETILEKNQQLYKQ